MAGPQVTGGKTVLAAAAMISCIVAVAVAATTTYHPVPYHRNAADRAACYAYKTAAETDDPLANINAIGAGANARSGDLGNLITGAMQRYGDPATVIAWCDQHGYPIVLGQ